MDRVVSNNLEKQVDDLKATLKKLENDKKKRDVQLAQNAQGGGVDPIFDFFL